MFTHPFYLLISTYLSKMRVKALALWVITVSLTLRNNACHVVGCSKYVEQINYMYIYRQFSLNVTHDCQEHKISLELRHF